MFIGSGTTVHVDINELPELNPDEFILLGLSRHLTVYGNQTIYDMHDPCREGNRAVYGYYRKHQTIK